MATAEEMAAYTARLQAHTSAQDKPVAEICVFKLLPEYAADHASALAEFESQMIASTAPGKEHSVGIRRLSWGFSLDDPATLVWMLDWAKIQDHWAFWQSPAFPAVMGCITRLFAPGRPLVRHYDFGEQGMLDAKYQFARILVRDDETEKGSGDVVRPDAEGAEQTRVAYAVDVDEMTWWCSLLGYANEQEARAAKVDRSKWVESHILKLKYLENSTRATS